MLTHISHSPTLKAMSLALGIGLLAGTSAVSADTIDASSLTHSTNTHYQRSLAPRSLIGQDMVLSIQQSTAAADSAVPTQGVIVQSYNSRRNFSAYGVGGSNHLDAAGQYKYRKTGVASAIEKTIDHNSGQRFTTRYQFSAKNFGTFTRHNSDHSISLAGQFSISPSNAQSDEQLAEDNHNGLTVAVNITQAQSSVVPKGYYPDRALVLQHYNNDGTYTAEGFGPAAIPHSGTYSYQKVSANVAVEQTIQVTDSFTLPFTMVYFYHTPTSGSWYQDFGNGTIKFSGVFSTHVTQSAE